MAETVYNKLEYDESLVDVVVAPQSIHMSIAREAITDKRVQIACQNVSLTGQGAFTGEISAEAVADLGASYVLTGHSERRHKYGVQDEEVAIKTK